MFTESCITAMVRITKERFTTNRRVVGARGIITECIKTAESVIATASVLKSGAA